MAELEGVCYGENAMIKFTAACTQFAIAPVALRENVPRAEH